MHNKYRLMAVYSFLHHACLFSQIKYTNTIAYILFAPNLLSTHSANFLIDSSLGILFSYKKRITACTSHLAGFLLQQSSCQDPKKSNEWTQDLAKLQRLNGD